MKDLLTIKMNELKARRDSAELHSREPALNAFVMEDYKALDALVWLRTRIAELGLEDAIYGGEGAK